MKDESTVEVEVEKVNVHGYHVPKSTKVSISISQVSTRGITSTYTHVPGITNYMNVRYYLVHVHLT
jgi:hypothetical protein